MKPDNYSSLSFFRSYVGSCSLKPDHDFLQFLKLAFPGGNFPGSFNQQILTIPYEVSLGSSSVIDSQTGMSVSLLTVDQILELFAKDLKLTAWENLSLFLAQIQTFTFSDKSSSLLKSLNNIRFRITIGNISFDFETGKIVVKSDLTRILKPDTERDSYLVKVNLHFCFAQLQDLIIFLQRNLKTIKEHLFLSADFAQLDDSHFFYTLQKNNTSMDLKTLFFTEIEFPEKLILSFTSVF
ncbi:MAG: hypothetical protein L6Q37_17050 [Bdellovibrionaceae bacterium]|nr:hypothetical protein [Pseudobdellovibrionaceae bacterium]NUM59490.1 hypothetical protein [Pseudobdellovibrionaceae bacterium]